MVNMLCDIERYVNSYLISVLQSQVKILDIKFKVRQNELYEMINEGPKGILCNRPPRESSSI